MKSETIDILRKEAENYYEGKKEVYMKRKFFILMAVVLLAFIGLSTVGCDSEDLANTDSIPKMSDDQPVLTPEPGDLVVD